MRWRLPTRTPIRATGCRPRDARPLQHSVAVPGLVHRRASLHPPHAQVALDVPGRGDAPATTTPSASPATARWRSSRRLSYDPSLARASSPAHRFHRAGRPPRATAGLSPMPSLVSAGSQPTTYVRGSLPAERAEAGQHRGRAPCHARRSPRRRGRSSPTSSTTTSPGRPPRGRRVTRTSSVVAVEQVVCEVHAADAVVDDADVRRQRPAASRRATSGPKPSSPRKMLPTRPRAPGRSRHAAPARRARSTSTARTSRAGRRPGRPRARPPRGLHRPHRTRPRSTTATCPARNMSCASARRAGRSSTRVPLRHRRAAHQHGVGLRRHGGVCGRVPPGHRSGSRVATPCSRASASSGNRVAAVDDRRRPRVGPAGGGLLLLRQRHHPQREDLVDLGRVEQVARALRRDLRAGPAGSSAHTRTASPTSTGHQPSLTQPAAAATASGGGSTSETKPAPVSSRWVPARARRAARSRLDSAGSHPAVLRRPSSSRR